MKKTRLQDLYEVGAIQANTGFAPIETEEENGIIYFIFEGRDEIEEASKFFWNGQLMVSAKKYAEALKDLKQRIYRKK